MSRRPTAPSPSAADNASPFVPVAVTSRYRPPKATIDPDRSKSWLKRALPIMKAHRGTFITALVLSFVGLVLQVLIPDLLTKAITNSLQHRTVPLHFYVWWVVGLGVGGAIAGYVSRLFLFKTAYGFEFDLRNIIYEHLTKMSFPFYDRVQSGQLISRANSDIRSVQMYMTFAPMILVQCGIGVVAFGFMLSINVPLAFVAMATMPFVYLVGRQDAEVDVPGVLDHPGPAGRRRHHRRRERQRRPGRQVVRRRAGPAGDPGQGGRQASSGATSRTPTCEPSGRRALQNLPQVGLALVLLFGGYMVIHGHLGVGTILAFNAYLLMLQAPFMMLGMIIMMGQRAAASADRIYEILDEQPTIVDRPGAVDLVGGDGDVRR